MTKHTPGPWKEQGIGTLLHPVTLAPVSTTRIETTLGTFEIFDETNEPDGNARLISAAPELLDRAEAAEAACRAVWEFAKESGWGELGFTFGLDADLDGMAESSIRACREIAEKKGEA